MTQDNRRDPLFDPLFDPLTDPLPEQDSAEGARAAGTTSDPQPVADPLTDTAERPFRRIEEPLAETPAETPAAAAPTRGKRAAAVSHAGEPARVAVPEPQAQEPQQHEPQPQEPIEAPGAPVDDGAYRNDDAHRDDDAYEDDGAYGDDDGGRRRGRGFLGCLIPLLALALVVGGLYWAVTQGVDSIKDKVSGAPGDYAGPGTGEVVFEVHEGDSSAQIGRNLKAEGVVKSVDSFIQAAQANPDASGIQVGFYPLKKQMKAADALDVLVDPGNIVTSSVTIPEGLRVKDIVAILADKTDFPAKDFRAVLARPGAIGLPDYADGNPEGYLFPATYSFGPKARPVDMIKEMVGRWRQSAQDNDLEARAKELGYTPAEMMTIASLVEAEGRGDDMPKIARVIYNRLEGPGDQGGTNGRLQIDATVNYALGRKGVATVTTDELRTDSPYNTYQNPGLPPGPIEAPGDAAIQAATHPAEGGWYYYVTVNLKTGETKFAETYDEFLGYKKELQDYCANESAGAC